MKKFFFFAVLASSIFASCSKITPETVVNNNGNDELNPITFQAVNYLSQTKADFSGSSFGTYAWFNGTDAYMTNQEITKQSNIWKAYDQTYYWPKSGSIDFISYAPYSEDKPWVSVGKSKLTVADTTIATTYDWLYADKAVGQTYSSASSGVTTTFRHALAQVTVKAKAKKATNAKNDVSWKIAITSAKIDSIATKGKAEFALDANNKWTVPTDSVWTASDFTKELSGTAIDSLKVDNAIDVIATSTVLPQALNHTNNATLHLTYTITTTMNTGASFTETFTKKVALSTIASNISSWKVNKSITYTITIDPLQDGPSGEDHEITFAPVVEDWISDPATHTLD